MKRVKLEITDLEEDLVLAEDLYVERRMLMRSGSILTSRLINLLKNRNVQYVHVFKKKKNQRVSQGHPLVFLVRLFLTDSRTQT